MDRRGTGPGDLFVGAALVELHLPEADSLKGKRAVLNKAKAALQRELGCSVAEVGHQDLWQRATLGIATAASSETGAQRVLDRVTAIVERDPRVVVVGVVPAIDRPV